MQRNVVSILRLLIMPVLVSVFIPKAFGIPRRLDADCAENERRYCICHKPKIYELSGLYFN